MEDNAGVNVVGVHKDRVQFCRGSENIVVTASKDKVIYIWDIVDKEKGTFQRNPFHWKEPNENVLFVTISPNERYLLIGTNRRLYLYQSQSKSAAPTRTQKPHTESIPVKKSYSSSRGPHAPTSSLGPTGNNNNDDGDDDDVEIVESELRPPGCDLSPNHESFAFELAEEIKAVDPREGSGYMPPTWTYINGFCSTPSSGSPPIQTSGSVSPSLPMALSLPLALSNKARCGDFSLCEKYICVGNDRGVLQFYKIDQLFGQKPQPTWEAPVGLSTQIIGCRFVPSSRGSTMVAYICFDGTVGLIDPVFDQSSRSPLALRTDSVIMGHAICPKGRHIVYGTEGGLLHFISVTDFTKSPPLCVDASKANISHCEFTRDGLLFAACWANSPYVVFMARVEGNWTPVLRITSPSTTPIRTFSLLPQMNATDNYFSFIFLCSMKGTIYCCPASSAKSYQLQLQSPSQTQPQTRTHTQPQNQVQEESVLKVLEQPITLSGETKLALCCGSHTSQFIAAATSSNELHMILPFSEQTPQPTKSIMLEGDVIFIEFSPNNQLVCVSMKESAVWILSNRLAHMFALRGHSTKVIHAAFDPSSKTIATLSADCQVFIWDLSNTLQTPRDLNPTHRIDLFRNQTCQIFWPITSRSVDTRPEPFPFILNNKSGLCHYHSIGDSISLALPKCKPCIATNVTLLSDQLLSFISHPKSPAENASPSVEVWNYRSGDLVNELKMENEVPKTYVALLESVSSRLTLAVGYASGQIVVWDVKEGHIRHVLKSLSMPISRLKTLTQPLHSSSSSQSPGSLPASASVPFQTILVSTYVDCPIMKVWCYETGLEMASYEIPTQDEILDVYVRPSNTKKIVIVTAFTKNAVVVNFNAKIPCKVQQQAPQTRQNLKKEQVGETSQAIVQYTPQPGLPTKRKQDDVTRDGFLRGSPADEDGKHAKAQSPRNSEGQQQQQQQQQQQHPRSQPAPSASRPSVLDPRHPSIRPEHVSNEMIVQAQRLVQELEQAVKSEEERNRRLVDVIGAFQQKLRDATLELSESNKKIDSTREKLEQQSTELSDYLTRKRESNPLFQQLLISDNMLVRIITRNVEGMTVREFRELCDYCGADITEESNLTQENLYSFLQNPSEIGLNRLISVPRLGPRLRVLRALRLIEGGKGEDALYHLATFKAGSLQIPQQNRPPSAKAFLSAQDLATLLRSTAHSAYAPIFLEHDITGDVTRLFTDAHLSKIFQLEGKAARHEFLRFFSRDFTSEDFFKQR